MFSSLLIHLCLGTFHPSFDCPGYFCLLHLHTLASLVGYTIGPCFHICPHKHKCTHTSPKGATSLSPVMVSIKHGACPSLPGVKVRWLYMCFLEWNASQEKVRTFVPETVRHSRGSCVSEVMWTFTLLWKSEVGFIIIETPFSGKLHYRSAGQQRTRGSHLGKCESCFSRAF